MNSNEIKYYHIRNTQEDIIGLFDKNGEAVVKYPCESFGKLEINQILFKTN